MVGGIVRDARSRTPLECLHVALADSSGDAVAHTVTDSAGRFLIEAPTPGVYRVRFESYGWDPMAGPLDTLREGDFPQRIYPVAFTDLMVPSRGLDSLTMQSLPVNKRFDKKAVDSVLAPARQLGEWKRSLEENSAWKSRRLNPRSVNIRYPEGLRNKRIEGAAVVRFIVDSTGRPRRESYVVIEASHPDFGNALRGFLGGRWTPSTLTGRPTCDVVQHYVRFGIDDRDPHYRGANIWIVNE
jgi:hypothetical protein